MADDYTPDEGHMSVAWVEYDDAAGDINEAEAEFDRFIAKVKRDAAREALAAAEHRATRAEAQAAIRGRAVVIYQQRARQAEAERDEWRQTALDERAAALDALDQIKARDARIKAVRDLHRSVGLTAYTGPRIKPSGEPIPDDTQVCDYCTDPDELGWCEYPCPTIRALDGDA